MDFFDVVQKRRSIRRFSQTPVPDEVVTKALETAVWAPNSSNTQTWNFYWVESETIKSQLIRSCFDQSAARTAQHLIVATANPKLWRRSLPFLQQWIDDSKAPQPVHFYYKKLLPFTYTIGPFGILGFVKWIILSIVGIFRPVPRGPFSKRDQEEVAIKSAALACENFVLAISAQGYDSCMMEGFDAERVSKLLGIKCSERIVMVIGVGKTAESGTWGNPFRIPLKLVVHRI